MTPHCLICESVAVLSKENANTAVMLTGTIESVLSSMNQAYSPLAGGIRPQARHESHLAQFLELLGDGISAAIAGCSSMVAFAQDVQKYQFRRYDYLCLRCGALFNQDSSSAPHNL